jgi:hypothetical protein
MSASGAFDLSNYAVKPRRSWPPLWLRRTYSRYDIISIPPTARGTFSFSRTTGLLQRASDGAAVLNVQPRESAAAARGFDVLDGVTNEAIGTVLPNAAGWSIVTAGGTAVQVNAHEISYGFHRFVARDGGREVCRFVWAKHGLSVMSAQLDIEFLGGAVDPFERACVIALAPVLEERARLENETFYH